MQSGRAGDDGHGVVRERICQYRGGMRSVFDCLTLLSRQIHMESDGYQEYTNWMDADTYLHIRPHRRQKGKAIFSPSQKRGKTVRETLNSGSGPPTLPYPMKKGEFPTCLAFCECCGYTFSGDSAPRTHSAAFGNRHPSFSRNAVLFCSARE